MKISRILLTVMVLSSILAISQLDTDNASNGGFKIAADRVGA